MRDFSFPDAAWERRVVPLANRHPMRRLLDSGPLFFTSTAGRIEEQDAELRLPQANGYSVISRKATAEKLPFYAACVYPAFSVLDPETTSTHMIGHELTAFYGPASYQA